MQEWKKFCDKGGRRKPRSNKDYSLLILPSGDMDQAQKSADRICRSDCPQYTAFLTRSSI